MHAPAKRTSPTCPQHDRLMQEFESGKHVYIGLTEESFKEK